MENLFRKKKRRKTEVWLQKVEKRHSFQKKIVLKNEGISAERGKKMQKRIA